MELFLVRHGETQSNVIGALDTAAPGAPLDELGTRQAAAVPAALAAIPGGTRDELHAIAVSTLLRTQQTAAPLAVARGLEPSIHDGLKEIQAGELEMRSDRHDQQLYNTTAWAWASGDLDLRMPGGENGHEFFDRYDAVIDALTRDAHGSVLVVSHGAAIRTWVAARCANTDGGGFAGTHQLPNTALVRVHRTRRGAWHLEDWGDAPLGGSALGDETAIDPTGTQLAPRE
ncbi:MAG TPA: histidine phosphatase family protein [Pseudolysinimonas sp.]|jgi:probable phosphoglycerate mutase